MAAINYGMVGDEAIAMEAFLMQSVTHFPAAAMCY